MTNQILEDLYTHSQDETRDASLTETKMGSTFRAVDLFCGGGGLSRGLVDALKDIAATANEPAEAVLEDRIDLVGVNHCEVALTTHEKNHPWARNIHDDIQHVDPRDVFDDPDPDVKIVCGGIECTHWSAARGGTPVDEQKRMPAWDVLTWVQKLQPDCVLFENVPEFEKWGPVDDDGQPTRNGETFKAWIDSLCSLGYSVDWQVLNAADYGDATTRKRLFVVGRRDYRAAFPSPTHHEDPDPDSDLKEWRSAAEIIDWSDLGTSIWERSRPLVNNTMRRIAEGIRRHCHDDLAPLADALDDLGAERDQDDGKDVILTSNLQENAVPVDEAAAAARERDQPFLVKGDVVAAAGDEEAAEDTCSGYLLGQQSGSRPRDVDESPVQTVATRGAIGLYQPDSFVLPRNGAYRGLDSNPAYDPENRPLHTVTAKNTDGHLVTPYLVPYYSERDGQAPRTHDIDDPYPAVTATGSDPYLTQPFVYDYEGAPKEIDAPVGTITCRDKFALCVPECYPWGLDIRFRMLQPRELAAAQGFPDHYEFAGNKTETTEQIGNAVPVNLAAALCRKLLTGAEPSLNSFDSDGTEGVSSDD